MNISELKNIIAKTENLLARWNSKEQRKEFLT